MDVIVVGDRYFTNLFRLLGIDTVEADDQDSASAKAKQLAEAGDCKVLIVDQRIASRLKTLMETFVTEKRLYPIFVVIPDFEGILGERKKELTQLVNRSVGVKLKTGD